MWYMCAFAHGVVHAGRSQRRATISGTVVSTATFQRMACVSSVSLYLIPLRQNLLQNLKLASLSRRTGQ